MCIPRMAARIVVGNVTVERLKKPTPRGLLRPDLDRTRCRSIVSSRKTPFLYGIHGRKVVASLKVLNTEHPYHPLPGIHGRKVVASLKAGYVHRGRRRSAGIHGRKVVASLKGGQIPRIFQWRIRYPRPKGRGLIEGHQPVPGAEQRGAGIHGRKVVASLKGRGPAPGRHRSGGYPRPKGRGLIEGT